MLFDAYEQKGLLFNMNFKEANGNYAAYRGDLVLELGEVGDALGHRKPPVSTIKNTIVLAENDKIKLYVGSLDELATCPRCLITTRLISQQMYASSCSWSNINKPLMIELDGLSISTIGMQEGSDLERTDRPRRAGQGRLQGTVRFGKDHHRVQGSVRLQTQGRQSDIRRSAETHR